MHLQYEQLVAYVDQAAEEVDREIVESHLEICSQCAAEAQDLRAFKVETMRNPEKTSADDTRSALWKNFRAFWQRPLYRIPLQFACAAVAMLLLVWIATLPLRKQVAALRAQLDEAQSRNDELQKQASTVDELQAQLAQLQQSLSNPPSQVAQGLNDGGRIVALDNQGYLTGMDSMPPQIQNAVKAVLSSDQAEISPELRGLLGRAGVLMGGSGEGVSFALLSPVGTVVQTDRPTFRWRPLSGATSYAVNVYDSSLKNVATVDRLSATQWTAARSLKRDEVYTWQVTALKDGVEISSPVPPAPEAKFKVLEQTRAEEVNLAKKSYPNSHLILGAVYKKAGLLDDAEREFKGLLSANPNSPVAQKLLQNVKSLRRK
ncbi:MAG TPA: zf-HC2 domain-containing protein [Blastocatellia bacterium]|jgi:hypothetical protein|nr:zf-HC2 domain-containing protein [Blastocatellia bacterium]